MVDFICCFNTISSGTVLLKSAFFTEKKTLSNIILSFVNLTSILAGCTFTSTTFGAIQGIIHAGNFPSIIVFLYASSSAAVQVIDFTYLPLIK